MFQLCISILMIFFAMVSPEELRGDATNECPIECICEKASMRKASFIMKWMTSWGEDDLPDVHPNDVIDANLMVNSSAAKDAQVDVDQVGRHATCSIHPTTNVSQLLHRLPRDLMVLSILQAPGCNLTFLEGGHFENLKTLKAIHLQGYAHECKKQVSGFTPNKVSEMIKHREMMEKAPNDDIKLRLALAEDALDPLRNLELLDMQYVRLVASKEERRHKRKPTHPVDSKTLLDMPLLKFLRLAERVDNFRPPPYISSKSSQQGSPDDRSENSINNNLSQMESLYTIVQEELMKGGVLKPDKSPDKQEIDNTIKAIQEDSLSLQEIIPYNIYLSEMHPELAPFKTLGDLKYLRVAHARLDRIGSELLDGLHKLHTLTLEYNNIQILPEGVFSPSPNLRHLSLAHNKLFALDSESFDGLSKLLTLDLDFNNLSILGANSLPPLPALETLRMYGNPITHLLPDAFSSLNNSKSLILGSPNVSMDIHEDAFMLLSALQTLVLENITMNNLEKTLLSGMDHLKKLTVHGHIPVIDYDAFSKTPLLRKLDLSRCRLRRVSMDAFFGLGKLRVLNLSHNELSSLSPGIFDHLVHLRLLYLHSNKLQTLPLGIFLPVPAKLIQLNHNPWICSCDLLQLKPSITNKITKPSRTQCIWDGKLKTVCTKAKGRLVYDARVAPLCNGPPELKGQDVYHAALRHLQCNKYHWDPRLLQRNDIDRKVKNKKKATKRKLHRKSNPNDTQITSKWLPLIALTPEPLHRKDLLEIAEGEGLEEVTTASTVPTESDKIKDPKKTKNSPQNDAPLIPNNRNPTFSSNVYGSKYWSKKMEGKRYLQMKAFLKEKARQKEKQRITKEMEKKNRLKALIKEKQKILQYKKMLKMKTNSLG